jgi:ankyrin repeat protein
MHGYIAAAALILAQPSTVFAFQNKESMTRLMIAAHDGQLEYVRKKAGKAPSQNGTRAYGWTVLMFVAWNGHGEIVQALLDAGAEGNLRSLPFPPEVDTVGPYLRTAALIEATRAEHIDIARKLVEHGSHMDPETVALSTKNADI